MSLEQPPPDSRRVVSHAVFFRPDGSRICCRRSGGQNVFFARHEIFTEFRPGFAGAGGGNFGSSTLWRVSACWLLRWISS